MLDFTKEEKSVVLFLAGIVLFGLIINFCLKMNPCLQPIIIPEINNIKLDINKATAEELLVSRCLSKGLTNKIIEYRNIRGPLTSIEELKEIKGIKDKRLERIKEVFCVK